MCFLRLKDLLCNIVNELRVCQCLNDVDADVDNVEEEVHDPLLVVPAVHNCVAWAGVCEKSYEKLFQKI